MGNGQIIMYQTADGQTAIDLKLIEDSIWLTQMDIIEIFQSSKANISEHIKHIYSSQELDKKATVRKFRTVRR